MTSIETTISAAQQEEQTPLHFYPPLFALHLLYTRPGTPEHQSALDAYTLSVMAATEEEWQSGPQTYTDEDWADRLNALFVRELADAAANEELPVVIVPKTWDYDRWRKEGRILLAGARCDERPPKGWQDLLDGLIIGVATVNDPRQGRLPRAFVYAA